MSSSKNVLHIQRKFVYSGDSEEIRLYLKELGYETKNVISEDIIIGFDAVGTTVRVDFDISIGELVVARGMISVTNNQLTVEDNYTKAKNSLKVYEQLSRRFREVNVHKAKT